MTGEVIRTELFSRIQTVFDKVVCPGCQRLPVSGGIGRVSGQDCSGSGDDYHIASFLYRHVPSVCLSVGYRVCSHIMCGERFRPSAAFGIIVDMVHQRLCQTGIVIQEERGGRICDVHCPYGAVAVVLFRKHHQFSFRGLHKLVGCDYLPVCESAEFCVFPPSCLCGLFHKLPVEGGAFFHQFRVLVIGFVEYVYDIGAAVRVPVWPESLSEIFYRIDVVISYQQFPFFLCYSPEILDECHPSVAVFPGAAFRKTVSGGESLTQSLCLSDSGLGACLVGCKVEVSPVDPQIISLLGEDVLLLAARSEEDEISICECLADGCLVRLVESPSR